MKRRSFLAVPAMAGPRRVVGERLPSPIPSSEEAWERYFAELRQEHLLLPGDCAFLNTGTLGVMPRAVVAAFEEGLRELAGRPGERHRRWGYEPLLDLREPLAGLFGCAADELALTHNSTMGLSTIANGLELRPGDEVLLTSHEHRSNVEPWKARQKRSGIAVRAVPLPNPFPALREVGDRIVEAIGPRTRVVSFSGIFSMPGSLSPAREVCAAARERGALTLVDGAHMPGQVAVNLREMGCDFWVGSPHKWMFAPPGCGLFYVRRELLGSVWPSVTAGGWDGAAMGARKFMMVGTNNLATMRGFAESVRFYRALGPDAVHRRIRQLAASVHKELAGIPRVRLMQPEGSFAGMISAELEGRETLERLLEMARRRNLILAAGGRGLRVSTHIHTRPRDLDLLFDTLRRV